MANPQDGDPLGQELEVFNQLEPQWLKQGRKEQFALVYKRKLIGFYKSRAEGLKAGYSKFGNVPFLLRRVQQEHPPLRAHGVRIKLSS